MYIIGVVITYLFLQMSFMWALYRILKNPSVVDVSWSIGLMVSGLMYLGSNFQSIRNITIASLLILWALRLAGYLWYTRIRKGHVDKRYAELSTSWKISPSLGFFLNFQLQGLLILLISSVFFIISHSLQSRLSFFDIIAVCVVLIGIIGETVADLQLQAFKRQHRGALCSIGLWNYSRHPNYFFDCLTWFGFALFGMQSRWGFLSFVSPFVLYLIFTRLTGPLTERGSIRSRGQLYIDYQKQTSMFFPWFKRKNDSV